MKLKDSIVVVSGLPRSGTSLMMSMLEATGIEPMQDGIREADIDNPKGYYEYERVKKIKDDKAWLPDAKGKVVKMISRLLVELPGDFNFKVIWMRRNIDEIIASQKKMLVRLGTYDPSVKDNEIRRMLLRHVEKTLSWMNAQGNIEHLFVSYNKLMEDPKDEVKRLAKFLGEGAEADAMMERIDTDLYRNRSSAKVG